MLHTLALVSTPPSTRENCRNQSGPRGSCGFTFADMGHDWQVAFLASVPSLPQDESVKSLVQGVCSKMACGCLTPGHRFTKKTINKSARENTKTLVYGKRTLRGVFLWRRELGQCSDCGFSVRVGHFRTLRLGETKNTTGSRELVGVGLIVSFLPIPLFSGLEADDSLFIVVETFYSSANGGLERLQLPLSAVDCAGLDKLITFGSGASRAPSLLKFGELIDHTLLHGSIDEERIVPEEFLQDYVIRNEHILTEVAQYRKLLGEVDERFLWMIPDTNFQVDYDDGESSLQHPCESARISRDCFVDTEVTVGGLTSDDVLGIILRKVQINCGFEVTEQQKREAHTTCGRDGFRCRLYCCLSAIVVAASLCWLFPWCQVLVVVPSSVQRANPGTQILHLHMPVRQQLGLNSGAPQTQRQLMKLV